MKPTITVSLLPDGNIAVEGPPDKLLCLGLLQAGILAVAQGSAMEQKRITPVILTPRRNGGEQGT